MSQALKIVRKHFPQVERVKDATKPIRLTVTKRDSETASKKDPGDCALARACKRQLKADGVMINIATSYVIKGNTAIRYQTSNAVGREITSFDRGAGFEEGNNYTLSAVTPSQRLGKPSPKGGRHTANPKKSKSADQRIVHRTENIRVSE